MDLSPMLGYQVDGATIQADIIIDGTTGGGTAYDTNAVATLEIEVNAWTTGVITLYVQSVTATATD